jgi:hypothetical protein
VAGGDLRRGQGLEWPAAAVGEWSEKGNEMGG